MGEVWKWLIINSLYDAASPSIDVGKKKNHSGGYRFHISEM